MRRNVHIPGGFLDALNDLASGLENDWPSGVDDITVVRKAYKQPDLVAKIRSYAEVYQLPFTLAAKLADAVKAREDMDDEAHAFFKAVCQVLPAYVGEGSADLAKYGREPPKERTPPTAQQQVEIVAKRNATRKARGTMGKRQRERIHGEVPAAPTPVPPPSTLDPTKPGS